MHGVTLEECRAALQTHSWSVPQAVNHLKVSAQLHALTLKRSASLSARRHVHKVKTVALIFPMQLVFLLLSCRNHRFFKKFVVFKQVKVIRLPFSQVEQLFSLGLRSRSECEELLQRCNWNLEESSTLILESAGSHGTVSAQLNR